MSQLKKQIASLTPTKAVESKGRTFKLRYVVRTTGRGRVPNAVYEKLLAQVSAQ